MESVLAQKLSGKTVMTSEGSEVGTLHNITIDVTSGTLPHLLVTPNDNPVERRKHESRYGTDDEGQYYRIPVSHVEAVKDYLLVE